MGRAPGEQEQLILLSLVRLGDEAYGMTIKEEIERRTGREMYVGAVYTALSRLEKRGYVSSRIGEPTAERGGRRRKYYRLEKPGEEALARAWGAYRSMADGIEDELEGLAARRHG